MNREDIIRMAREAQEVPLDQSDTDLWGLFTEQLEHFAALVAAAERKACARVCDDLVLAHPGRADLTADQCAQAIRARGSK